MNAVNISSGLSTRAQLLLAIASMGGEVRGRTLLQKRMYLLSEMLEEDLGFRSHLYGPYSSLIHAEAAQAVALGFLSETILGRTDQHSTPGDNQRVDYILTELGSSAVSRFSRRAPEEAARITMTMGDIMGACGNLDGASLSLAAKVHFILTRKHCGEGLSVQEIREEATKLRWDVTEDQIVEGASSLARLSLVNEVTAE